VVSTCQYIEHTLDHSLGNKAFSVNLDLSACRKKDFYNSVSSRSQACFGFFRQHGLMGVLAALAYYIPDIVCTCKSS